MKISWAAVATTIAGGALTGVAPLLGSLFPKQQVVFTSVFGPGGLLILVTGFFMQSQQPASKIVADAPVVNPDGSPSGATNVSTSSALLPVNQKGTL